MIQWIIGHSEEKVVAAQNNHSWWLYLGARERGSEAGDTTDSC